MLDCADLFERKSVRYGSFADAKNLTGCLGYCLDHAECGGVDFNDWEECYWFTADNECRDAPRDSSSVNHYRKLGVCDVSEYSVVCIHVFMTSSLLLTYLLNYLETQ